MSQTQQDLELLILRIHSGLTYLTARQGITLKPEGSAAKRLWAEVEAAILAHRVSALEALSSLKEHWALEREMRDLIQSRAYLPELQTRVLMGGAALLAILSQFFFPPTLRAETGTLIFAFGLGAIAYFWSRRFLRDFQKDLWIADWNLLLSEWKAKLESGSTFLTAYLAHQASWAGLPKSCQHALLRGVPYLQHSEDWKASPQPKSISTQRELSEWARGQIDLVLYQATRGLGLAPLLGQMIQSNSKLFRRKILEKADRLQLQLMLPVLTCLFPAFLGLLFGPLLTSLLRASK